MNGIDGMRKAIDRYQTARPELRVAMRDSAVAMATTLADERDALMKRLEDRWRWCDANKGHLAYAERERVVLAELAIYEHMEDALRDAAGALFGEAA